MTAGGAAALTPPFVTFAAFRAAVVAALLALAAAAGPVRPVLAWDFPDNRQLELDAGKGGGDPEYRRTLDKRQRQQKEEAAREGESHTDVPVRAPEGEGGKAVGPPELGKPVQDVVTPEEAGQAGEAREPVAAEPEKQPEWRGREAEAEPAAVYEPAAREQAGVDAYIGFLIDEFNRAPEMRIVEYAGNGETPQRRGPDGGAGEPVSPGLPDVGAGDALYARVLYDVNSDYPGPVMLQLLQRPLYGAVARGEFRLVRDRLVVNVRTMDIAGETVAVDAVAVGLDCACYGLAGDVSYHWWDRVILPAATGFVESFLIARSRPERRIVETNDGGVVSDQRAATRKEALHAGAAAAAGRVGEILLEQAPSRQTVVIPRNTELAVMFVERLGWRRVPAAPPVPAAEADESGDREAGTRGRGGGPIPVVVTGRGVLQ